MQTSSADKDVSVELVEVTDRENDRERRFCYTKLLLKDTLQFMGCKTRVAHKSAKSAFLRIGRKAKSSQASKQASTRRIVLAREEFQAEVMCSVRELTEKAVGEIDLQIACRIVEQRRCVILLLAGTSGTGKSTLASLLASKLGITTVVSTDSIRHMLRSFSSEDDDPVLWTSTYQAGDLVPKAFENGVGSSLDSRLLAIQGYKAQCEPIVERIEKLVSVCEARNESLVMEGVHLSINAIVKIMAKHPSVLPFLVYISNEVKHKERFAVRAKYMALDPGANRYVKHLRQIRVIQDYLVARAERHCIPRVDNTNVDRSVAAIHATVLSCLKRQYKGESLLEPTRKVTTALAEDYEQCKRAWSSKSMVKYIQSQKGITH